MGKYQRKGSIYPSRLIIQGMRWVGLYPRNGEKGGLVSKEWRIMEKGGLVSKEWRIMEKGGLVSRIMEKGGLVSKEWRLIEKSNLVFKDIVGLANISFPLL